jgi:hypothetical protein
VDAHVNPPAVAHTTVVGKLADVVNGGDVPGGVASCGAGVELLVVMLPTSW